eukprot:3561583-Pleurochrysis_carterae.AAC.2
MTRPKPLSQPNFKPEPESKRELQREPNPYKTSNHNFKCAGQSPYSTAHSHQTKIGERLNQETAIGIVVTDHAYARTCCACSCRSGSSGTTSPLRVHSRCQPRLSRSHSSLNLTQQPTKLFTTVHSDSEVNASNLATSRSGSEAEPSVP